jgi:hypothetical protein
MVCHFSPAEPSRWLFRLAGLRAQASGFACGLMGNTQSCCNGREKLEVTTEPKPKVSLFCVRAAVLPGAEWVRLLDAGRRRMDPPPLEAASRTSTVPSLDLNY